MKKRWQRVLVVLGVAWALVFAGPAFSGFDGAFADGFPWMVPGIVAVVIGLINWD